MKILALKLSILTSIMLLIGLAGCASAPQQPQKSVADLMNEIKSGMTKEQVTSAAGQPKSRSMNDDGTEMWQYRQTARAYKGQKKALDILSFGMGTMSESQYQDILNVTFTNSIVVKVVYQENVNELGGLQNH